MTRTILLVLAASIIVACTKTDPAPAPAPSASNLAVETSTGVMPPQPTAAVPSVSVATSATPAPSGSAAADCGGKENPCPLQGWMKENINPPMNKNDLPGLAAGLDKIVAFAPAGYTNWASIAKDGAAAARSGDMAATKASCRTCHDQYKQKYKTEMRARKI